MRIVIVDSGIANVRSVFNMLKRLRVEAEISTRADSIASADAIVLPGVGSFDVAMLSLIQNGLKEQLDLRAADGRTPILGICLGMQLMADYSEEGQVSGLGWIPGAVKRLNPEYSGMKRIRVPHMGWNLVKADRQNPLFKNFDADIRFYFDHSYHFVPYESAHICGLTSHGGDVVASINKNLLFGVQFHPEKSHRFGMKMLENFVDIAHIATKHSL